MTMDTRNYYKMFALIGLCLSFAFFVSAKKDSECPGPTKYYEDVGCTPVFKTPESKCPEKYNCDILKDVPEDKCFINGHTYEIGEPLSEDDANPCNIGCFCSQSYRGPQFLCASVSCYYYGRVGCYQKRNATSCCGGPEICPDEEADRATCSVNGKIYRDGEHFRPETEPEKDCYCGEGYTGENIEPFCVTRKTSTCEVWLNNLNEIREGCVPTYNDDESQERHCTSDFRCPEPGDSVRSPDSADDLIPEPPTDPDMQCSFGNLTLNVGDQLEHSNDFRYSCMECVCEVPPVLTCRRLPFQKCNSGGYPRPYPVPYHHFGSGGPIHISPAPIPPVPAVMAVS